MSKALNATGRPILYSLCQWGQVRHFNVSTPFRPILILRFISQDNPWDWASTIANTYASVFYYGSSNSCSDLTLCATDSYRISGDIYPSFDRADDKCPCETYECTGLQGFHCSVTNIVEKSAPIGQKVRAGR